MKCNKCGYENQLGVTKCIQCGNELSNNTYGEKINEPIEKNSPIKYIIILIVLLIFACGGIFIIKNNNKSEVANDKTTTKKVEKEKNYQVGDEVELLDGSKWYVLSQDGKRVTLIYNTIFGEPTCYSETYNDYEISLVKKIIDEEFLPKLKQSLKNKNGNISDLEARIISLDDIEKIVNATPDDEDKIYISSDYKWLFSSGSYWTMTLSQNNTSVYLVESWSSFAYVKEDKGGINIDMGINNYGTKMYVRPVITTTVSNIK